MLSADAPTGSNGKQETRVRAFTMLNLNVTVSSRFAFIGSGTWNGVQARFILGNTIMLTRNFAVGVGDAAHKF